MYFPDCPPRFDTELLRPYWQALERGALVLPACSECGRWQWYPAEYVKCHSAAHHEWKPVASHGTVFTFTVVHRSFLPGAVQREPYTAALVEPAGLTGVRIPTFLVNLGEQRPSIGMAVRLVPLPRSTYTAPAFEPCTD